ncbi:MAG: hypothetical protein H7Y09_11170, partial [Chitinophagaceae bacterium]|nr:hypothetical protein [Anaerolineae bacterium]
MNRSGDQGWLVVGGLGLLLVCAVIAVLLQGQQVSEANENLDAAHVTLTAYADERDAISTAAGATLGAANDGAALIVTESAATQAGLADQQATVEAEITALAEDFAATQTQSANLSALVATQQSVTVLEAQNSAATVQAEATAEIIAVQTAARQEAFSIAASTSQPAFENFATSAAATQAALQAEVTEALNLLPTIEAQQTLIADYERAEPELAATFAPPTATQTIQQQTAPISIGGELIAETFDDAAAWEALLADTNGQALIEEGALVVRVAEAEMRLITLGDSALENAIYAEVELTMRDCTTGAAGLAFDAPEDAGGYLFTVSCALDAWTIARYDAS